MEMEFERFTVKNVIGLAAPHTWVAAIFPVLLGTLLAAALADSVSPLLFVLLLAAAVLLQSSVNTINDYYDFIKGNDSEEDFVDPGDSVLVYNKLNPGHVRFLGFSFMATAVLLGIYPVYHGGILPLLLGIFGCLVIIAYSAGKWPLSHLPLGEAVSGGVMGGLLTVAVYSTYTGYARWDILLLSCPLIIGIGLIMMTNNTCDIERDMSVGRKTMPTLLGRARAVILYRLLAGIWLALLVLLTAIWFSKGLLCTGLVLLLSIPALRKLWSSPLTPNRRGPCMDAILKANLWLNGAYLAGIFASILLK